MADLEIIELYYNDPVGYTELKQKKGLGFSGQKKHVIKTKSEKSKIKKRDSKTKKTDETKKEKKKSKSKKEIGDSKTNRKEKSNKKKLEKSKIKKKDSKTRRRRRLDKNKKEKKSISKKRDKEPKKSKSKKRSLVKGEEEEEDEISPIKKRRTDENKKEKKKSKKRPFIQEANNIIPFDEWPLEIIHSILLYIRNTDFSTLLNLVVSKSFFQTFIKPRIETTIVTLLYLYHANIPQPLKFIDAKDRREELTLQELKLFEFYFNDTDLDIISRFFKYYSGSAMIPKNAILIYQDDIIKNLKTLQKFMAYLGGVVEYLECNNEYSTTMFTIKHYSNIMYTLSLFDKEITHLYKFYYHTHEFYIRDIKEEPSKGSYIKDVFYLTKESKLMPLKELSKIKVLKSSLDIKWEYKRHIINTEKNEALKSILQKPLTNISTLSNYAKICNLLMSKDKLKLKNKKKKSNFDLFEQVMIRLEDDDQYINIFSTEAKKFRDKCFLYEDVPDPNMTYQLHQRYAVNHKKDLNILKDLYNNINGCIPTKDKLTKILLKLKNEMSLQLTIQI